MYALDAARWWLCSSLLIVASCAPSAGGRGKGSKDGETVAPVADSQAPQSDATDPAGEDVPPDVPIEPEVSVPSTCISADNCVDNSDCASGHRCNKALSPPSCQKLYCGVEGSACSEDGLCTSETRCKQGVCVALHGVGGSCEYSFDCKEGLVCGYAPPYVTAERVCASQGGEGAPCGEGECVAPLICRFVTDGLFVSVCASPAQDGAPCYKDVECASGACNFGTCGPPCKPSCTGKECGPDGCGGQCGKCTSPLVCNDGTCALACQNAKDETTLAAMKLGHLFYCFYMHINLTTVDLNECLADSGSITYACLDCTSTAASCAFYQCSAQCQSSQSSPACTLCIKSKCATKFDTCSGLSMETAFKCTPACDPSWACGSDGCGGQCGACSAGATCDAAKHTCTGGTGGPKSCWDASFCIYDCATASCIAACTASLAADDSKKLDDLENCLYANCQGSPNTIGCRLSKCPNQHAACGPAAWGTKSCAASITCANACSPLTFTCFGGCLTKSTQAAAQASLELQSCIGDACDSSDQACVTKVQQSGGACYVQVTSCQKQ